MSRLLSVIAVVLAAGSFAARVALPGPAGPRGPTGATDGAGPQGPAGSGTIQAFHIDSNGTAIGSGCTDLANVTIVVPGPGTVVVSATAAFWISHTNRVEDFVEFFTST